MKRKRRLGLAPHHTSASSSPACRHQIICGNKVVTPRGVLAPGYLTFTADGDIAAITAQPPPHTSIATILTVPLIVPGHVDIHNHGVGGAEDVLDYWNNPCYTLARLAKQGTTSCLATVVFLDGQSSRSTHTCGVISSVVDQDGHGCVLRGIHAEGPVVATLGGLPESKQQATLEDPDLATFSILLDNIGAHLKIMTISPSCERGNNCARLRLLAKRNIKIALGHDKNCTELDILKALHVVKPARCHTTHVFNVQSFHHRNAGLVNFAMVPTFPKLSQYNGIEPPTVEVICDFRHVSAMALQALFAARSPMDVCCITDAIAESIPGKKIKYSSDRVAEVSNDGQTVNIAGTNLLCGSCTSMHATFRKLIDVLGVALEDAVLLCSTTPSVVAGIDRMVGSIDIGKRGDVLLLDENLNVLQTVVGGCTVWSSEAPMEVRTTKS